MAVFAPPGGGAPGRRDKLCDIVTTDTFLVRVTEALRVADWSGALSILDEGTPELEPSQLAEALEAEAQAAYGAGEFERAIEAWERLHAHELELSRLTNND